MDSWSTWLKVEVTGVVMMLAVLVTRFPARALMLLMMFCRSRKHMYTLLVHCFTRGAYRELLGNCNSSDVADGIAGGGKHVGDAVQGRGDGRGVEFRESDIKLVKLGHLLLVDVVSELLELVDLLALLALLHSLALLGGRHGVGRLDRQSGGEDGDELELHFGGLIAGTMMGRLFRDEYLEDWSCGIELVVVMNGTTWD